MCLTLLKKKSGNAPWRKAPVCTAHLAHAKLRIYIHRKLFLGEDILRLLLHIRSVYKLFNKNVFNVFQYFFIVREIYYLVIHNFQ